MRTRRIHRAYPVIMKEAARYWDERRYYSLASYLKNTYGTRIIKLSLNGGMSCPNRDGTLGDRGCIFCSEGGSGDFAADSSLSITEQIESAKLAANRRSSQKYIAYFQAYTNTYGEINYLRKIFMEAILDPDVCILSIATRPDCMDAAVLKLLSELNGIKPVWVELGLQTIHEDTARLIRRGYPLCCFTDMVCKLEELKIHTIVHMILGLPGESHERMLESAEYMNLLPIRGVKLQLLHILKNTELEEFYFKKAFHILSLEEYTDILIRCVERLNPQTVIHRITGDGPKNILTAPLWSANKRQVLNNIQHTFKTRNTWQGKYFTG